ncbi:MAG: ankyrin repeat domain-containing protein [Deltaproteobacteria bacterium]|nr:ankyrin repeat domain-containing protein [Deltaproteobacteria bacterium]
MNAKNKYMLETPLHLAAESGHADVVRVLVTSGADVNAKTLGMITYYRYSGMTPLEIARTGGKTEVVRILENAGSSSAR